MILTSNWLPELALNLRFFLFDFLALLCLIGAVGKAEVRFLE
jgi:hypothetical protein